MDEWMNEWINDEKKINIIFMIGQKLYVYVCMRIFIFYFLNKLFCSFIQAINFEKWNWEDHNERNFFKWIFLGKFMSIIFYEYSFS